MLNVDDNLCMRDDVITHNEAKLLEDLCSHREETSFSCPRAVQTKQPAKTQPLRQLNQSHKFYTIFL